MKDLLSAGEFAKLARTTKRTVLYYHQQGILRPYRVNSTGYRFYQAEQILDFQVLLLLRQLNFSIEEIKEYLKKNNSLKDLFELKKESIKSELKLLEKKLNNLEGYYSNLDNDGILIKPEVKEVDTFEIFYIYKEGAYSEISTYCDELASYFEFIPEDSIFLTIYTNPKGYNPKTDKMKIGVVATKKMKIKSDAGELVKLETIPHYKALAYYFDGQGELLSLIWKSLGQYFKKYQFKASKDMKYEFEFYHPVRGTDEYTFKIHIPII